jgi:hypothetical protein
VAQALGQPFPATIGAGLIGQRAPRDAVEPEAPRVTGGHVGQAPPGNEEGLGHDVGRVLRVAHAAQRVGQDRASVRGVQVVKARLRGRRL